MNDSFYLGTGILTAIVFLIILGFMLYLICKAWHAPLKPVPMDTELGTKANPAALGKFFS
ncbi:hypothetical protein KUTeg_021300 [Tegillarca granosa]|uniref:ATP synthase F0 subunit 8 n=1 Tax=Tegillarca granosa TaxID=220873 RepID=A0ABQ9EAD1_TEGGR|nr:hypothetical protein KUTeg_021300 [Tegillarca granosa]